MREHFDQLRAEAHRRALPDPATLRVRSDRRAARRMTVGLLAVVLLLGGGYYATRPEHRARFQVAQSSGPSAETRPTPARTSAGCRDRYRKEISLTAFVPGGSELCFEPADEFLFVESVPTPCRPAARPTDALIEDRRGFENVIDDEKGSGPTVIHQVLTRYSAQGAAQFVSDLSRDAVRCPPFTNDDLRLTYSVIFADADSVRLAATYEALQKDAGPPVSTYLVLIGRVGSYVAVVYDKGRQGYPSRDGTLTSFYETLVRAVPPT